MLLKCVSCGDDFEGHPNGMWICNKCKNKSNSCTSGYNPNVNGHSSSTIYKSERDIIINPQCNKVVQVKKFINASIEDINKWLLENNVKEVISFSEQKIKKNRVDICDDYREWTETIIVYKIEV